MVASISVNPTMTQQQFEKIAETLFKEDSVLRNIAAAPGMKIKLMYPVKGNEQAIGLDYRNIPAQFRTADLARQTRKVVLAGPVDLVQGGSAFIARFPIYLRNDYRPDYFWGVVSSVIDKEQLFRISGLYDPMPVEIAIRGKDSLGERGEVFHGNPELFTEDAVLADIQLPIGSWQLTAAARGEWATEPTGLSMISLGFITLILIILAIFIFIVFSLNSLNRARQKAENARQQLSESLRSLHEREMLLQSVVNEIPDAVLLKDSDNHILLGNQAAAKLYRTTPEDFIGRPESDFSAPRPLAEYFARELPNSDSRSEARILLQLDRQHHHYRVIKKAITAPGGEHRLLVIAQDISDIVSAQEQVIESEYKLRTILDNVDAYIYLKDTEGRYLFANKAVRELWRAAMEDIIGSPDERFFDAQTSQNIRQNDARVLIHGETIQEEETNTVPETGQTTTFQSTKLPLKRDDGSIYALCGISVDISRLKDIEKALRESEQRFMIAGQAAYDLIYERHLSSGQLIWFGDINSILGYPESIELNRPDQWMSLIHPDDQGAVSEMRDGYQTLSQPLKYEYRILHQDGGYRYWSDHALPLLDDRDKPYKWIGVCKDITDFKRHQAELEHAAYHDKLTGLPNRDLLSDRLQQAMGQERRRGETLAVVYLDLDGFKEVNDQYGHETGDKVLMALGKRFRLILREGDTIARLGGDEFVAVLLNMDRDHDAMPLLKRLQQTTTQPIEVDELTLKVSSSLGVTFYPQHNGVEADQLIRQADQAMYQAKLAGKNRIHFFDPHREDSIRGQRQSLERIRQALSNNEFELYYQPRINMKSGELNGVEALIRWQHPEQGLLLPGDFLPALEDHPLCISIGQWVLRTALSQLAGWKEAGLDIHMSINITALELQQSQFVTNLQSMIDAHPHISPTDIELEILETSALEDIEQVSDVMRQCQNIGISFALDDFGTGYSSLKYLKHLPAAVLKIDRSFVRDMLQDPDDLAILEGIMGMSNAFRRTVVAEGVEQTDHGTLLIQLGCELAQGNMIARPMPAAELSEWHAQWTVPAEWQNQRRINHDDFSLLFSAVEHKAWVTQIEKYLDTAAINDPAPHLLNCRFGEWLKGEGKLSYAEHPSFSNLLNLHEDIHSMGQSVCDRFNRGENDAAREQLPELNTQVDIMFGCLRDLLQSNSHSER
nr:EAL domain-containing protein [Aliamphritea spongicola]